ncbi:MAG: LLM class flavin-dependent oxidoreductase [bacterium]
MPPPLSVGTIASPTMLSGDYETRKSLVEMVAQSGIDHVFIADHVSFHTGMGMDGMLNAATVAAMHPTLKVCMGVYLLALRHPVPVARQLATLSQSAPGRIILGVGIGGEDRHEMEICGVDPATRGRQTNDCLEVIRGLMTGKPMSFKGEFFEFDNALIKPAVSPPIPIVVGGRADAAIRRAGLYSEGWLGIWCSPRRFIEATSQIETHARNAGRSDVNWNHGLQIWAGIDNDTSRAREILGREMQNFYQVPFKAFEKYTPCGSPQKIADSLKPFRDAGCRLFNIKPCAVTDEACIEGVAKIRELLTEY